ncbi:MAG: clan AA aspartic protease [Gemmatimonadaceae bacterium]|nr:clan AA aspartic protease [Gemmatimonadaceae bacterium]NUS48538.1 clan AA aspartic protease [Gemmatimonadaceae bacterium]
MLPLRLPTARLAFGILLLGALACRAGGVAQPEYDAAGVVEGDAAPRVRTDTVDDPFTVRLDRARWVQRNRVGPQRAFWDDIAVLDIAAAEKSARSLDEKTFVLALRTLMAGDPEGAAIAFAALHAQATEPAVRTRARVGLTMALSWRSDWPALARIGHDPDSLDQDQAPSVTQAGVERWARALAAVPLAEVFVPEEPATLPMRRSAFGTPVVTVRINGHPYQFWLDTGASMTLLSAAVAVEAGVVLAAPDTLALGVVAGHIPARAVLIDSLAIGPMVARGLGAAVVNPGALRLDRAQHNGVVEAVQIDGVIGTDLLRHLDLVLDAGAGTMTIRRPRRDVRSPRNLFWVGYPVVKLVTRDGRPILFGLDTGAEGTFVTTALLRKLPRTPIAARHMTLGGLGPEKQRTQWVVRDVALSDGDYAIALRNTPVTPEHRWTFVTFDGMIGSDVALATRMHLDFTNGIFDVRPSAARPDGGPSVTVRQQ